MPSVISTRKCRVHLNLSSEGLYEVFWDMNLCGLVDSYRCFRGTCCLQPSVEISDTGIVWYRLHKIHLHGPQHLRSVCISVLVTIQHEMKAVIQSVRSELDERTACHEATETEPDPGMMQSTEEHQEIPKEEAAVMPVGGLMKRRRDRNLAAGRR
jgi:hypothetical protein